VIWSGKRWESAREAKRTIEERMLDCLRQRNGEYNPDKLAEIKRQGGSDIYINLTSVKCRAATSWLRDTLLGTGTDKPWSLEATPEPTLPPELIAELMASMQQQLQTMMEQGGQIPDPNQLRETAQQMKDSAMRRLREEANERVDRMELKMEDQLIEGGWTDALNTFLDDVVTFPYAVLKGPVKRKRKTLAWQNGQLAPSEEITNEWERVDPFMFYWAPWCSDVQEGFIVERTTQTIFTTDLIDALQMWDSVKGSDLLTWGLSAKEIPDADLNYPCEVWLVGSTVIRAVLNYDPLGRKPYYVTSYEKVPGAVAGKGVADLCRDSQNMVNASARALANNMGISSGPQVGVNVSRLPPGEDITEMHPWKIWQFQSSEFNDGSQPLTFYQPNSNANELMAVFEKFSARADEDTMIPRYMTGENTPGAGRTSSGLSMLISNAGKGIKQVISNIDRSVIVPSIERLYQDNLRYSKDPDLIGDVKAVAKGANSLVVKEAEAIRRNEFLTLVLNSPVAQQIVGMDGAAELLREQARNLSGNVNRIVPDRPTLTAMQTLQQQNAQLQEQLAIIAGELQGGAPGAPGMTQGPAPQNTLPDGSQVGGREGNMMSPRPNGI